MRVCHIVPSLEERHGGPSKSVRALANAMAAGGTTTDLLTTHMVGSERPTAGSDAASIRLFPRDRPRWLCRSRELQTHLRREHYDCIHHHALWLATLHHAYQAARQQAVPLIIAPRGMMSAWAWRHRRWKKALAETFVHPGALGGAAGWHATSDQEAADIRALGFRQPICVAPNGVTIPSENELLDAKEAWLRLCPALAGRPVALFYSRFHRKKRLRELIELWAARERGDWFLLVVGVPEEFSLAEVQSWLTAAGLGGRAAAFDGQKVPAPYAIASLLVLPSHSENFGLVIAEALAAGVPALVTDTTPWQQLLANHAGWCVSWDRYSSSLDRALDENPATRSQMGARGREWMQREFTWKMAAERLVEFYSSLRHA